MHVRRLNKPIFAFPSDHPARQFLEAFIKCFRECIGRELDDIDQRWFSETDGRICTFSSFAYENLAFDIEMDGWLSGASQITASEQATLSKIPRLVALMEECRPAAIADGNSPVVQMCDQVIELFRLWTAAIKFRLQQL